MKFLTNQRSLYNLLNNEKPDLTPRRLLCVVVVTTSAWSKGEGMTPAATRPEMCAMSASSTDLVASQIERNLK